MSNKKPLQKLELTWIGKGEEPKLEPRILIENPEYSYGDPDSENMLIHGDNLLALKALEQDYAGKVKCIYIDPPYNTGNAFEHYDDGVEHSLWLSLMSQRLKILESLLSKDGAIAIHLDDQEVHYAKVICDDIFGRSNFLNSIIVRDSHPSGLKLSSKDKTIIKTKSQILVYKKSKELRLNPIYQRRYEWDTHYNTFMDSDLEKKSLKNVLIEKGIIGSDFKIDSDALKNKKFREFCFKNRDKIFQSTKELPEEAREESSKNRDVVFVYRDANGVENYALNGRRLFPLSKSIQDVGIDGSSEEDFAKLLCDFWDDIDFNNTQNEGGVNFPASKKPEYLVGRILTLLTNKGDLVLDSFLGSGTTAAVAHKMGRRWIGVELGEHAKTHCFPRLKAVVDGEQGGISKAVNWQGGGGFKFYTLAPSLLKQDKFGNWVISQEYNADMLAAAMAKQEGYKYQPHESTYWKQGQSSEQDFIFTTTQFLTVEALDSIRDEMQPGETLMICCKSFQKECKGKYGNITIKKIPQMLLGRCEYGKEDYSLNIINLPIDREDDSEDEEPNISVQAINDNKKQNDQPTLF
ncbi:MAG: site-specific DNA-methyltransferase [Bacteroidetes bacterium]|nr:site-specific DNA-methyltransferase [Bacteroidota bacterium]